MQAVSADTMTMSSVTMRSTQPTLVTVAMCNRSRIWGYRPGGVLHHHDHLASAVYLIHRARPMPLTILPGIIQLARSPVTETQHRAKHCDIKVAAAMIPNEVDELKNAAPGSVVTVSLPALIKRITSSAAGSRRRDAVLRVQDDMDAVGNVVGNQGGHADAKVDTDRLRTPRLPVCGHLVRPAWGAIAALSPLDLLAAKYMNHLVHKHARVCMVGRSISPGSTALDLGDRDPACGCAPGLAGRGVVHQAAARSPCQSGTSEVGPDPRSRHR